ncbi:MAG: hypothetical protein K1X54_05695 [Flavobacteriales bacterium]|nr:hypothetical protein [Flavobacteriales bacterium]
MDSLPQKHAVVASRLCQDKKFDEAKVEVEQAIESDLEKSDPYTWYIRGYIFKELYKDNQGTDLSEGLRITAVQSFLKSQELSPTADKNNDAALGYLASTYFRDAINAASSLKSERDSSSFDLFDAYRNIQIAIGQDEKINSGYMELLQTRSRSLLNLLSSDQCNEVLFLHVKSSYEEILATNPTDCIALYNLAITYYNTAVFSNNATPDAGCYDTPERLSFLEQANQLLKKMEMNCEDKQSAYRALINVLRSLENHTEAEAYEGKLKLLTSVTGK